MPPKIHIFFSSLLANLGQDPKSSHLTGLEAQMVAQNAQMVAQMAALTEKFAQALTSIFALQYLILFSFSFSSSHQISKLTMTLMLPR